MKKLLISLTLIFLSATAFAQKDPKLKIETTTNGYLVRHVVFNSTFLAPEVASLYGIKRSKYESILNVSVAPEGQSGSIKAKVEGSVTNLMQQQKSLALQEIEEKDAVYYIAPIRVSNEELLHFKLSVTPTGSDETLEIEFSQTVYADE